MALSILGCGGSQQPMCTDPNGCTPPSMMTCTPACDGKNCGDDGCGGSCGNCPGKDTCQSGVCTRPCQPMCFQKQCGDDGCGGSCGTCSDGVCIANLCQCNASSDCRAGEACVPNTNGGTFCYATCDPFASASSCPSGQACNTAFLDQGGNGVYTSCAPSGDKLEGQTCTPGMSGGGDCSAGLACVQRSASDVCMRLCNPSHACKPNQTCSTLTVNGKTIPWGGCDPPED